ncbi:MAG: prepilin-type N-terminal cleavage/methylation domain-containing protein [Planctomycetaceae bacterium]|jgi:prepilin-type N-terminal cleavage/methylation domain-containing protein|nr:prepilin-type N-terminal cleavage/methylation domain-containing protein [Phycisphaerales bacterium]MCE2653854.1 prepilin-type N-terminal cleavage/methylation domain-containing protein [Planctomycetaceae bacterium]
MPTPRPAPARAFTLVELLVVIAIIAIISTIALVVGSRVAAGGKVRATESILATLETVFESYKSQSQSAAPSNFTLRQATTTETVTFPIFDGRNRDRNVPAGVQFDVDNDPAQPSLTLFLLAAAEKIEIEPLLKNIDSAFIERRTVNAFGWVNNAGLVQARQVTGLVIKDGFGQPIRYVHPAFHGGAGEFYTTATGGPTNREARDVRDSTPGSTGVPMKLSRSARPFGPANSVRTVADADEGLCVAGRPYFYSAGPDKNPGTRDDNLYSTRPTFPTETAHINAN